MSHLTTTGRPVKGSNERNTIHSNSGEFMSKNVVRLLAIAIAGFSLVVGTAAYAAVPAGKKFDLTASLVKPALLDAKALKHPTVMQSFAYDPYNNDLYTMQVMSGESAEGNLVVTKNPRSGNPDYMVLNGFGHGATMGLQKNSSTSGVYLWVESHSVENSKGDGNGTRIARVKWSNKARPGVNNPLVTDLTPPNAVGHTPRPVVDQKNGLLVVRTTSGHTYTFTAYTLTDAAAKVWTKPVYTTTVPQMKVPGSSTDYMVSQGTTAFGNYVYLYWGENYDKAPAGNTYLQSYKIVNGKAATLEQSKHTEAYKSLDFREPEGINVYKSRSSAPVLAFGFASGKSGARKATIAGKP